MVTEEQLRVVARDEKLADKVTDRRIRHRLPYRTTEEGLEALADIVRSSGFFDVIENPEQQANRNFVVRMMEDMGLLDECNLQKILAYMLDLEVFPGRGCAGRGKPDIEDKEDWLNG